MKTYSDQKDLKVVQEDSILWLSLDNPSQSNAITTQMIHSLVSTLKKAQDDKSVRVVVLTGEGKSFCAGGDLKAMSEKSGMFAGEGNELRERYQQGIQQIPLSIEAFSKPIIAMIHGPAIGAGCDLACMCDLRMASKDAKFGETFNKLALVPGDGGTFFLPRVVGYAKAMEMFLTAKVYDAHEAHQMGLVNEVVEADKLYEKTKALAQMIAANSPMAQQMTKKALKAARNSELNTSLDLLAAYQGITQRSDDHFEALKAFSERRSPQFKGR